MFWISRSHLNPAFSVNHISQKWNPRFTHNHWIAGAADSRSILDTARIAIKSRELATLHINYHQNFHLEISSYTCAKERRGNGDWTPSFPIGVNLFNCREAYHWAALIFLKKNLGFWNCLVSKSPMILLLGSWRHFPSWCHCMERVLVILWWARTTAVILLQVPEQGESILPVHVTTSLESGWEVHYSSHNLWKSRHVSGLASTSGQIQSWIWLQQTGMVNSHELRKDSSSSLIVSKLVGLHSSSKCP